MLVDHCLTARPRWSGRVDKLPRHEVLPGEMVTEPAQVQLVRSVRTVTNELLELTDIAICAVRGQAHDLALITCGMETEIAGHRGIQCAQRVGELDAPQFVDLVAPADAE